MTTTILFTARWLPFRSSLSYRIPLVADSMCRLRELGARVIFASPDVPEGMEEEVEVFRLPAVLRGALPRVLFGAFASPQGRRDLLPSHEWLRGLQPDLVVAVNANALPLATILARPTSAAVALFSLGGVRPTSAFRSPGAFLHVGFEYFLPQFLPIFAFANVEDSSGLHRHTPVENLPLARQLRLPIPHTVWPRRSRSEAERIAGLEPTGRSRVTWAGRFEPAKRPEQFVRIAKDLCAISDEVDVIMVGAPTGPALELIQSDPILRARIHLSGRVPNERLVAIAQASDLMVFTASISVTGTIFREALAAHVPVACTVDPSDSLLFTLVDVGRDVIGLPLSSPRTAAESIVAALQRKSALAEQADRAARTIAARGIAMDEFVVRVADFFLKCGQDARAMRSGAGPSNTSARP